RLLLFLSRWLHLVCLCLSSLTPRELYPLSLHDALPIYLTGKTPAGACPVSTSRRWRPRGATWPRCRISPPIGPRSASGGRSAAQDRKSTRLNSSHEWISYAVFCLKENKGDSQCEPYRRH